MRLVKYHGLGNDYLVVDEGAEGALAPSLVAAICERHRGVGGDGILLPVPGEGADYGVRIYNPDGSEAEKSGNGLRIFARWLHERRAAPRAFSVSTPGGLVRCAIKAADLVEVEMGRATAEPLELAALGHARDGVTAAWRVNVGNPHCCLFTDAPELDALPWRAWGAALERHRLFLPDRTNVQLARVAGEAALEIRIYERGAGPTEASGSSACAVAAAAVAAGRCPPGPFQIHSPGGTLRVQVSADLDLTLTGPVTPVATITLHPPMGPPPPPPPPL